MSCYLCFGFNERGARIHFSVSYIIYLECIAYFSSSTCQQNHPDFAVCLGVGACSSSQKTLVLHLLAREPFIEEQSTQQPLERAWWGLWGTEASRV